MTSAVKFRIYSPTPLHLFILTFRMKQTPPPRAQAAFGHGVYLSNRK